MDEPSIQLIGGEAIDNTSYSVYPDLLSTDGKNWKATYQISQQDNGTLEWIISELDRAGNPLGLGETDNVSTLGFNVYNNFSYEADNSSPLTTDVAISSNTGKDYTTRGTKLPRLETILPLTSRPMKQLMLPTWNSVLEELQQLVQVH